MAHETYLSYTEYVDAGGTADQISFPVLEMKSRKRIDYLTDSRVQDMASVPNAVKLCMVALIEMESKVGVVAQTSRPTATSFNTDGYSESYGNVPNAESADLQMNALVSSYLYGEYNDAGIPLLYRGIVV